MSFRKVLIGSALALSLTAAPASAAGIFTVNLVMFLHENFNGYDDKTTFDHKGYKEIQKWTDGTAKTVSKGATLNPTGNGGTTSYGTRSIPDALCLKGRQWACDGEVIFAITSGAGQSNVYLGDVVGSKAVCDIAIKTRTGSGPFGYGIDDSAAQRDGKC